MSIQEYVAKRVIEHMEYRDKEIEELRDTIKKIGCVKCSWCQEYSIQHRSCGLCDRVACSNCSYNIKLYRKLPIQAGTWGEIACDECASNYPCDLVAQ